MKVMQNAFALGMLFQEKCTREDARKCGTRTEADMKTRWSPWLYRRVSEAGTNNTPRLSVLRLSIPFTTLSHVTPLPNFSHIRRS
jgi:hypothetical protein